VSSDDERRDEDSGVRLQHETRVESVHDRVTRRVVPRNFSAAEPTEPPRMPRRLKVTGPPSPVDDVPRSE